MSRRSSSSHGGDRAPSAGRRRTSEALFAAQRERIYRTYPDARIFTMTMPGVIDISSTELRAAAGRGRAGAICCPGGLRLYPAGRALRDRGGPEAPVPQGAAACGPELSQAQAHPPCPGDGAGGHPPCACATARMWRRPGWRPSSTTARRSWRWRSSWRSCRKYGIPLDELEQKALKLLHAKTGAAIARDVFGVDDEIYRAI